MEKTKFRCHFSIIFENTAALWIFLAVVLFGQIQDVIEFATSLEKEDMWAVLGGFLALIGLTLIVFLYQFLVWRKTYIVLEDQTLVIQRLTVNRKENTFGIKNISNINLEQNLFEMIMGTYKIKIDTNTLSTANKTDIKIVLSKDKAVAFKNQIMEQIHGEELIHTETLVPEDYDIKYELNDIVKNSLVATPLFAIFAFVGVVVLIIVGLTQVKLGDSMLDFAKNAFGGYLAIAIAVMGTIGSTIKNIIKFYAFRVKRFEDRLLIGYGLLKKRNYEIPIDMINAIKIKQSTIARIFKFYCLEIINVGVNDENSEVAFLILYAKKDRFDELLNKVLPEFTSTTDENIKLQPKAVWKVKAVGMIVWTVVLAVALVCIRILELPYVPTIGFTAGAIAVYLMIIAIYIFNYRTEGICVGDDFLGASSGTFFKSTTLLKYDKIQYMDMRQGPISRKLGLTHGYIYILAAMMNRVFTFGYFAEEDIEKIHQKMKNHKTMISNLQEIPTAE